MIGQRGWGGGDKLYSGFSSNRDDRGILGGGEIFVFAIFLGRKILASIFWVA